MPLATIHSRAIRGLDAVPVKVEVHIAAGLPSLHVVGLPEKAVRESQYRVRAAIAHSRFEFPCRRVTVNLAPADLPKGGGRFDLPIALGVLAASGQLPPADLDKYEFTSELGLDGGLRPVRGVLPAVVAAGKIGRALVIAPGNAAEAGLVRDADARTGRNLLEVCAHFSGQDTLRPVEPRPPAAAPAAAADFADVLGQHHAARALEIAAAGGHNCLMAGAPGSGKTMLATRLPGILPPLLESEAIEVAAIRSLCGEPPDPAGFHRRPFRAPHHTASAAALAGGGSDLRPGEVTRAHCGVLFLDELPEFGRRALEILREPIETGVICIARAAGALSYPSDFQLIAAMNPCPDGADIDERGRCPCDDGRLRRYYARLSAPLLDRIDMHVRVPRLRLGDGRMPAPCPSSAELRARVAQARRRQAARQGVINARLPDALLKRHCALAAADATLLMNAMEKLELSLRAANRIVKMARSIADLEGAERIARAHLLEALGLRAMDKLFKLR